MTSETPNTETIPHNNEWKLLICRAKTCQHNIENKCLCGLDFGLEINEDGTCLHYTKIKNRCYFCGTPTQPTDKGQTCPECGGRPV